MKGATVVEVTEAVALLVLAVGAQMETIVEKKLTPVMHLVRIDINWKMHYLQLVLILSTHLFSYLLLILLTGKKAQLQLLHLI